MTAPLRISAPETGGRRALALAIMALVAVLMMPTAGLVLAVFGLIIGIRDLRALQTARQRVGMAIGAVMISSVALMLGTLTTAVQFYFSSELAAYTECRKGAGTVEAQQACADQLMRSVENKLGVPLPAGFPTAM